jgi:hypothetical protein
MVDTRGGSDRANGEAGAAKQPAGQPAEEAAEQQPPEVAEDEINHEAFLVSEVSSFTKQ